VVRVLVLCALFACACPGQWRLEFVSDLNIKAWTPFDQVGLGAAAETRALQGDVLARKASGAFGGISALAFDEKTSTLYTLSDSTKPVVFSFKAVLEQGRLRLTPLKETPLLQSDGSEIPTWTLDPEGLVLTPAGTLLVSSEGYPRRTPPSQPAIVEFSLDGRMRRSLPLPEKVMAKSAGESRFGVRPNNGFEALTLSPDRKRLYTGTEGPLEQDGPSCSFTQGCMARIIEYRADAGSFIPGREYAYPVEVMTRPQGFEKANGSTGLSDMLAVGDGELLTLERSYVLNPETKNGVLRIRVFQVDLAGATDVAGIASLQSAPSFTPVSKRLVLDLDEIIDRLEPAYRRLDNMEGICFGPRMSDGTPTVILVSDDNYSETQRTVFLVFRLKREQS